MSEAGLALVTGASSGIGAAFAQSYARRGFDVALVARRADRLERLSHFLSTTYGVAPLAIPTDLSNPEAHLQILAELRRKGRSVGALVNCAGYGIAQTFAETQWESQRDFLTVCVVNLCGLTYGVLPEMISRGQGSIINVASVVALAPDLPGYTLYPAAKSFVLKFSRSLRLELRQTGVSVTAVCPGFAPTEFHNVSGTDHLIQAAPRFFSTPPASIAEAAIAANSRGRAVIIPGWHNKVAAFAFKYLPQWLTEPVVSSLSAKYRPAIARVRRNP